MTLLRDISVIWSLIHTLILFMLLFESRYDRKKTLSLTLGTMLPLILVNFLLFIVLGPEAYMPVMLAALSLPSLVFFWFLARHRDGRFVFTFCMVDTVLLELIYITNIIDQYIPDPHHLFMFSVRLVVPLALEYFAAARYRQAYIEVQNEVRKGWWLFALTGSGFYLAMTLAMVYPEPVVKRPDQLPVFILLFILMPLSYLNIFTTLRNQQLAHRAAEKESILSLQAENMKARIAEFSAADEKFRLERHNFRHKMQTIAALAESRQYDELIHLVGEYSDAVSETQVRQYSRNAVIDAALSAYILMAQSKGIRVSTRIAFPDAFSANETELAAVLANALENAIHACEKLEAQQRVIDIRIISAPRFMIQVSNSFDGSADFDENGIPVSCRESHGLGTRFIVAFCEKNHAFYEFKVSGDTFSLRIVF